MINARNQLSRSSDRARASILLGLSTLSSVGQFTRTHTRRLCRSRTICVKNCDTITKRLLRTTGEEGTRETERQECVSQGIVVRYCRSLSVQSRCDFNCSTFQSDLQDSSLRGGGDARIFTGYLEPAFFPDFRFAREPETCSARICTIQSGAASSRACTLTRRARETVYARRREEKKKVGERRLVLVTREERCTRPTLLALVDH